MEERFNVEALKDLVTQEARSIKLKYTAIEPIMHVIMSQWRRHRHWNFFELSSKHAWLLDDPSITTICLYRCLEKIKSNATQYFLAPVNRIEEKIAQISAKERVNGNEESIQQKRSDEAETVGQY